MRMVALRNHVPMADIGEKSKSMCDPWVEPVQRLTFFDFWSLWFKKFNAEAVTTEG